LISYWFIRFVGGFLIEPQMQVGIETRERLIERRETQDAGVSPQQ
jgi:hypothetical protein